MLLASAVDAINRLTYLTQIAAGMKKVEPPTPVPRPGVKPGRPKRKPLTAEQRKRLIRWIRSSDEEHAEQVELGDGDADGGDGDE